MKRQKPVLSFSNVVIDKKQLKYLIIWAFRNYGIARAANMADRLKDLGFYYATKAGISLSLEDLRIPPAKKQLLKDTVHLITAADSKYKQGEITAVERFQKVIDTWNSSSEMLKQEVVKYFKETDPLNAIYMMAFSGARGNIAQVRQLVGMRGLMSDPQGQIIDLPIASNFREGLTVTDYFISSYGARKGLVDTALRTADSGYLTRRLVDVAQDVIVRETDCKTSRGILLENILDNQKILFYLEYALIGRLLAEDIYCPETGKLIAISGQDIDDKLARQIVKAKISKVLIRSPITCDANGSVCQKCYGWNLAHGRLVDLGEAVGIIAAQSIGEPGTQLTMRTFHTGGVFTGEFSEKIYAPFRGTIEYSDQASLMITRTSHGEKAYLAKNDCFVSLINMTQEKQVKIFLNRGSLCLFDNKSQISKNQIIAEYPLKNRLSTEKAQKSVISDIAGKLCFTNLTVEEVENRQHIIRSTQTRGLIWVLSGQVYNIPDKAEIMVFSGTSVKAGTILAMQKIISNYSGYIRILSKAHDHWNQEVLVVTALQILSNVQVFLDKYYSNSSYVLKISDKDRFLLSISPGQNLVNGQILGELLSDVYKTQTGGIVKYLDLPVSKMKHGFNNECYNILDSGYVLWIAEETHEINKDISLLLIKHGDWIEAGTEIIKNLFAQNSGVVEILEKDRIVREIIIKPCQIYPVDDINIINCDLKKRGFLRPGDKVINHIRTNKLVYWEYLECMPRKLLLIRPVIVYSIPKKQYNFIYSNSSFNISALKLCLTRRIYFKDGARVKSVHGVDLVKTYLIVEFLQDLSGLSCSVEFGNGFSHLKLVVTDSILIKNSFSVFQNTNVFSRTKLLVSESDFVSKGQVIAQTELLSNVHGQILDIQKSKVANRKLLMLTRYDQRVFKLDKDSVAKVQLNDWVYKGQEIADGIKIPESGQIIDIKNLIIVLRIGRPYLISHGSILHVDHGDLIQRGDNIATLIFDRVKTGDIVQGLPRIEEILEARKKANNMFNPHLFLEEKFRFYLDLGLSLYDATRVSMQEVQLMLVKEVQLVYRSQGVDIADKHIEVIVRQMTARVEIEQGGETNHLPGEIVPLQKIEAINKLLLTMNKKTATYYPVLLGITKASLNTESFISAASFQETTKVLTEAAISGKLDWLRGLKENVIIGRLIPAGTGFNLHNIDDQNKLVAGSSDLHNTDKAESFSSDEKYAFEDIILDDRTAKTFPDFKQNLENLRPDRNIM